MAIYFYSHKEEPYGPFSNFSHHGFMLGERYWPTSEHYFQAQKFVGTEYEEAVRLAPGPMAAARMGRENERPLRPDWEEVKDGAMRRALRAKFTTHPTLRELLLSTEEEDLIEKTSGDYYWGCGTRGDGKNMLGILLMELREKLRVEAL